MQFTHLAGRKPIAKPMSCLMSAFREVVETPTALVAIRRFD
jgi:hypothetical protein